MSTISIGSTTTVPAPTSVSCVVDETLFPHLFLVPAGIIITILAFLRKRTSFRKDVFGGRPGLVVPMDFIGNYHDRLAIVCVFGAATGSIVNLILGTYKTTGDNAWEAAFLGIGTAFEVAILYYPFFGCLASYHRIIGALMGFPYAVLYFSVSAELQKCNKNLATWSNNVDNILPNIPTMLCQLFIMGKFVLVLYKEIKEYGIFGLQLFSRDEELVREDKKLVRPWLLDYATDLFKLKPTHQYSGIEFYLRKIYNPERNFKFSTQTLSVVMICCILLYNCSTELVFLCSVFLEQIRKELDNENLPTWKVCKLEVFRGVFGSFLAATLLITIFCMVSLIRFMENHKNYMLRMFKGDKSFIPKKISSSQFMIGKGLRYPSYQIGYFLWGYILLLLLFTVICFMFYALISYKIVQDFVVNIIKGGGVVAGLAIFSALSLPLAAYTIFRDYTYSKNVISLNNRNVYMVFSYFWFFIGLTMGFFSAICRILKAMIVGALMLPRIDHSVMPDGFQQNDRGFNSYICFLHVQTAYRNPILRVFCQILCDETQHNTRSKWACSPQARARWFLALTLARNPQLASDRKPDVLAPERVQGDHARLGSVVIEVGQFSSDNDGLLRDK